MLKTQICRCLALAFGCTVQTFPVWAQDVTPAEPVPSAQTQNLQRVEVTGSAIRRIDAETTVPLTVVKMDDIRRQGITTVEQLLSTISASQTQQTTSQAVGASTGGASFANLRGLGANKTLILLNGRRIANNAFDSSAPDLNTIPFAVLDRVEVLRDGASSLYGTDAVGGVINFITRQDYQGGTITLGYDKPQAPGGKDKQANLGLGFGDLNSQGFNVFGFVDYNKQQNITGTQRPYNTRIAGGLSGSTSPGQYYQGGTVVNPIAPSCAGGLFTIPSGDGTSCRMTTSSFVDYVPKTERLSGMLRGTLKLNEDHQFSLEYFATENIVSTIIAPVPYGALFQNPTRPDGTRNPYYPTSTAALTIDPAFNPSAANGGQVGNQLVDGGSLIQPGYVNVKWRDAPNGPRRDENINTQQRLVGAFEGTVVGWDYQLGLAWNENKVNEKLIGGYTNGDIINEGVLDGVINPYGAQSAAGDALLASASALGQVQTARGTVTSLDGRVSREVGDWFGAGRKAALAVGGEYRHEGFTNAANPDYAALVVASTGIDPNAFASGSRHIEAAYTELNVPIVKMLDITAAVRYDKYSDFGSTTNPKISFRLQPIQQLLFRGSYTTGFRAPSLYDVNRSNQYTTTGQLDNPITCPNGVPTNGIQTNNCASQFEALLGGNRNLTPEKSKNANLGFVLEPVQDLSLGIDYWWIKLTQQITSLPSATIVGDYATFSQYVHALPNGALSTDGSQCPNPATCGYIDTRTQNLGGVFTDGLDLSASYRMRTSAYGNYAVSLQSTYVAKYQYQDYQGGPWNQNVGVYVGTGPIFRWQHTLNTSWNQGPYSLGMAGHYHSGYTDEDASHTVASYTTFDLFGSWAATKKLSFTAGIRNLFDKAPPFSNQVDLFQAGYDPRYTDPTGRVFYARGTFNF